MTSSPDHDALLVGSSITVTFGGVKALSDVDCHVNRAEIVGIIGPNGAGKTTLLNVLSRFIHGDAGGNIQFNGADIVRRRPRELAGLGLARTFQTPEISPSTSVWSNVLMGAHTRLGRTAPHRTPRKDVDSEAWTSLETLGIARWATTPMQQVPYATRKRAEICRAILARPSLLLLDEPASGMSTPEKRDLANALRSLHESTGTAVLVIEHDVGFLLGLCDRLMALDFGLKIADGAPDEVVKNETVIDAYLGREGT